MSQTILRLMITNNNKKLFFNLNKTDWASHKFWEQNRLFLGLSLPFKNQSFSFGYMNQALFQNSGTVYNHILYLTYHINT